MLKGKLVTVVAALALVAVVLLGLCAAPAFAASYAWDPGDTAVGGVGTWNTSSLLWDSGATAPVAGGNVAYTFTSADNAYIGYETTYNPGVITLGTSVTLGALNFGGTTPLYTIATGTNSLTLNAGGSGTGLVDFSGAGNLYLKNDLSTAFNVNVQAATASGTVNFDEAASNTAGAYLSMGNVTVSSGRTLTFSPGNTNTFKNYGIGVGTVANSGTVTLGNGVNGQGLYITGQYTGAGSGTSATDQVSNAPNYNTFYYGSAINNDGSPKAGEGGIWFANGLSNNVGAINGGSDKGGIIFGVQGVVGGAGTTVHITKALYYGNGSSRQHSGLYVRQGGSVVFDSGATVYMSTSGLTANTTWTWAGDGMSGDAVEFLDTSKDYGYNADGGATKGGFNPTGNGGGTPLGVGPLNWILHASSGGGTSWSIYNGAKSGNITFTGNDDGATDLGYTTTNGSATGTYTVSAGLTIKDAGTLTFKGTGASLSSITFSNSRFVDVQNASGTLVTDAGVGVSIATGKTVSKKGLGAWALYGTAGGTGTLAVTNGTVNLYNASFAPGLNITGGTVVGGVITSAISSLASLAIGAGNLQLSPDTSHYTTWTVAGAGSITNGATLTYSLPAPGADTGNDEIVLGGALTLDGGTYTLNLTTSDPNSLAGDHTIIAGGAALIDNAGLGTWNIEVNGVTDPTETVKVVGNNLVVSATPEPGTLLLLAVGGACAALAAIRRRRAA
ncbi:MAG: PEP-CTERM sorting domain-containing protein [Thermoguttaceae bacterium]|jgi:hypothetical protein